MYTSEMDTALRNMANACKNPEQKAAIEAAAEMLGNFDEEIWGDNPTEDAAFIAKYVPESVSEPADVADSVVIVVEDGRVDSVYASSPALAVEIIDKDTQNPDEAAEADEAIGNLSTKIELGILFEVM